jgi:hypothetical protein
MYPQSRQMCVALSCKTELASYNTQIEASMWEKIRWLKMSMMIFPFVHQSTSVQIEVALAFLVDASLQRQHLP